MNGRSDLLRVHDRLPHGLLDAAPSELAALLGGPALIHLEGQRGQPVFVTCLLHGNEVSGFLAVQRVLRRYAESAGQVRLPRPLSLFIGNVFAAERGVRRLPGQPDYNRVWPGAGGDSPEHRMTAAIVAEMRARRPMASIDIHNNTGRNPHYACINRTNARFLHLAGLFSRTQVYFTEPKGVQSLAMAALCPATTIECGHSGEEEGVAKAALLIDACLHLDHLPDTRPPARDFDLYHTIATVKLPPEVEFATGGERAAINLPLTLEYWNFCELPAGTAFARQRAGERRILLSVTDAEGVPCTAEFFTLEDGLISLARPVIPSMLTSDATIIRQDCLCYFMERIPLP